MHNPVNDYLREIYDQCRPDRSGEVYDYAGEDIDSDPELFGLCVATVDGYVYEVGDTRATFPIQSISKPFTYGLALADLGFEAVGEKIDVEPSGEAFNEISVSSSTGRPSNPMINSGAITATSLISPEPEQTRVERIVASYSRYAGRELTIDEEVYAREQMDGHRNRAIGHMLREFDILNEDPDAVVDEYLRQCSVSVDCRDLSLMAATLANGGLHPVTGERASSPPLVEHVLSVMTTCGMYDDAGDWVSAVGMPAKSGVSGAIIAVLPGQLGIAVYSPRTDIHGNSVRGVETFRRMSRDLELHFLHVSRSAKSAVRASYDILQSPSRRRRSEAERDTLAQCGRHAHVYEMHGDLLFAGAESMMRTVAQQDDDIEIVVLDVRRVDDVADVARTMLVKLRDSLKADGRDSALVDPDGILSALRDTGESDPYTFTTRNAAIEWCEDQLIDRYGQPDVRPDQVTLLDHPLLGDIDAASTQILEPLFTSRRCVDGEMILAADSPAEGLHLILSGHVGLKVQRPEGGRRISTLSAGMSFGEFALVSGQGHQFDVIAEGPVELAVLTPEALHEVDAQHPEVAIALWQSMARDAYTVLDQALREVAAQAEYGS